MLQIAKVLKSNGTDGDILIGLFDIAIEEIDTKEPVFIEFDGLPVPFFFESLSPKGTGKAIAHITDVDNLEDAEEIAGRPIYADYFEEEEDGEDFSGWTLYDKKREVGIISGLEPIPGNPCLIVSVGKAEGSGKEEVLVPLHEDFVIKIDEKSRRLVLDIPDGLIP